MSAIRGVLLAGKFRTQHELNQMSADDQRNTLIVELTKHSNQSNYQSYDDDTLAGMGAVMVFLRETGIRDDEALRAMSADDQRNTLIVELGQQNPHMASRLQGFNNLDLVLLCLGYEEPGISLRQPTFLRGVLLAGKFRSQHELNQMSADDQRNTLIVELTKHSNQSNYQSYDDYALAGMGAVMVFLRETGIRDDEALRAMSADDQRNTLIVELGVQTGLGSQLQGLGNLALVAVALGADPAALVHHLPPPLRPLPRKRLQFRLRGWDEHESTDDTFQGARDETYLSAIGTDSATLHFGQDGRLTYDPIHTPIIGRLGDDSVRGPWAQHPHVLVEFDLERLTTYPRDFFVTLMLVEHDNSDLRESFDVVENQVGKTVKEAVISAATSGGAAIGTAVLPGIGTAVGAAAGALAGLVWDGMISAIEEGLANEVFTPRILNLMLDKPVTNLVPEVIDQPQTLRIEEQGAIYDLHYDWHIEWGD